MGIVWTCAADVFSKASFHILKYCQVKFLITLPNVYCSIDVSNTACSSSEFYSNEITQQQIKVTTTTYVLLCFSKSDTDEKNLFSTLSSVTALFVRITIRETKENKSRVVVALICCHVISFEYFML